MAITKIRGNTQIMDQTIDLGRLEAAFLTSSTGNWNITNGTKNALITGIQLMPTDDSDVASKWYVDQRAEFGVEWKMGAQYATSTGGVGTYNAAGGPLGTGAFTSVNLTSTGVFDLGGRTVLVGDRVLVKDQSDQKQNGIYIVTSTGATGGIYRSTDMDGTPTNEVSVGVSTMVDFGYVYKTTGWTVISPPGYSGGGILTLNTDDIIWTQFSGIGSYTAGVALELHLGTEFNVLVDNASIGVNGSNQLEVKTAGIKDTMIDWGTSTGQVSGGDIPIADAGDYFTINTVEAALQELAGGTIGAKSFMTIDTPFGTDPVADTATDTLTLQSSSGAIQITGNAATDTVDFTIAVDGIKDTMIDWGTSTGQVDGADIPVLDPGGYFTSTGRNVQDMLQEIGAGLVGSKSFKTIDTPLGTDPVADSTTDTLTLTATDGVITITGNSGTDTIDFGIAASSIKDSMINWGTSTGQVSGGDIPIADIDNYYSTDNVEAALKQIGDGLVGPYSFKTISTPSGTSPVADIVADTLTLLSAGPITITGNSVADSITFGIGNAGIKDSMVDWGTSTGQVNAEDVPIIDINNYYTSTGVEGALKEIAQLLPGLGVTEITGEAPTVTNNSYTVTLANTPKAGTAVHVYLNGLRQQYTADYTRAGTTITFVDKFRTNDVVLVDYYRV